MADGATIIIVLSGSPRGKGRPRFNRTSGRVYQDAATFDYETNLRYAAQKAMGGRRPVEGPLTVFVTAHFPIPESWSKRKQGEARRGVIRPTTTPDADNILKMLDACNEICFRDDKQIVDARIVKSYSDRPMLRVEIAPADVVAAETPAVQAPLFGDVLTEKLDGVLSA